MVVISVPYLSVTRGHQEPPASEHAVKKELQGAGVSASRGKSFLLLKPH